MTCAQCDTTRPECRKCRKRGWKCPGYRDLNALRIVDETQKQFTRFSGERDKDDEEPAVGPSTTAIIRQYVPPAERTTPKREPVPSPYPSPVSQAASPDAPKSPPHFYQYQYLDDDVPRCVSPPMGDSVFNYFVQNFVQGSSLRNHGYLDFLFPLLASNSAGPRDNALPMAFSATAMIAFAARQKALDLIPRAESIYLRALEATVSAIGDPDRAKDNSTLACVTLLTTFEVCTPSTLIWLGFQPKVGKK